MLRLTFILCSGLFLVMLLGGRDFGQLRPGLARAEAEAERPTITADVPVVETVDLPDDAADKPVEVEVAAPATAPVAVAAPAVQLAEERVIVAAPVVPADQVLRAHSVPVPAVPVPAEPENTVFTLSDYADPLPETTAPVSAEQSSEGEIWYVAGNSVNVRSGPSTDTDVVGKLTRGEATLVVWREGADWARIKIEGDGVEGYVAMRFLTPNVPVVN